MNQKCEDLRCFGNVNGNCAVLNGPNYAAGKRTYEPPKDTGDVLVEVVRTFDDVVTGDRRYIGAQFKTTNKRAQALICGGFVKRI